MTLQDLEEMLQFTLKCSDDNYQKVHVDVSAMLQVLSLAKQELENENE